VILEALEACAGEFRPTAGELRAYLNHKRGERERVDVGRCLNPFLSDRAIAAVADALKAGEKPCRCEDFGPSQFHHDGPRKSPDGRSSGRPTLGVLRCRTCHGLEWGQVHEAQDAGLLQETA
jgi:hypothetical protein